VTEVFATGIQMGESPRWHDGRFWMCDWVAGEVLVFDADGNRQVVARVEGLRSRSTGCPTAGSSPPPLAVW
jgi:sugar lactone lactonase YvrE